MLVLVPVFIFAGCKSSEGSFFETPQEGVGGEGASGGEGDSKGGSSRGGSSSAGTSSGGRPAIGPSTQLAPGPASLAGITSDGWAVFRDADALRTVKIGASAASPATEEVTRRPGSVLIRGRAVFNWADVDWTTNLGDLSVWTEEGGAIEIGETLYAEGLVAVSESGSALVYAANPSDETFDLVLLTTERGTSEVLIESVGRGSEETCGARIGFVRERLFVGWCEVGSRAARLERYDRAGDEWRATLIAEDALPEWSADAEGESVFYQSSAYAAYCDMAGEALLIDASVGRGLLAPDGSAAFYTVGDQLRRTALPDVDPVPVVTRGYAQPVGFSPRFDLALYSTVVTYENGTERDLFVVPTDEVNAEPVELVPEPTAQLARSMWTDDGRFVLFLTDKEPRGASLHVVASDGKERMVLPDVVEVLAAYDSTIVFTDNSSDPEQYPVVADLKLIDVASETEPTLLEEKILEGRSFVLDSSREHVVYVRSGVDRDVEDAERDGLFVRSIR